MKQPLAVFLSVLFAARLGWTADAKSQQNLSDYLDQLQVKLEHTAKRANQPTATGSSVAGLRGSKQEPMSKQLYWKGKTGPAPISIDEVKMFRTAIETAKAGKKDEAAASLKSFVEQYPQSSLKGDAEDTLKMLASLPAASTAN